MGASDTPDQQLRDRANAVAQRIKDDAAFRDRVEVDPCATLEAVGLPVDHLVIRQSDADSPGDVSGYMTQVMPEDAVCLWWGLDGCKIWIRFW